VADPGTVEEVATTAPRARPVYQPRVVSPGVARLIKEKAPAPSCGSCFTVFLLVEFSRGVKLPLTLTPAHPYRQG